MLPSQLLDCEKSGRQRVFTQLVSLCLPSLSSFWFPFWVRLGWSSLGQWCYYVRVPSRGALLTCRFSVCVPVCVCPWVTFHL